MNFLEDQCSFHVFTREVHNICIDFSCNDEDLDDFFNKDCHNYSDQLLGKTYCFRLDSNLQEVVCAFTLSNDSIKASFLPNARKKKVTKEIPQAKQMKSYPAVLIGRLGVNKKFRDKGIGTSLLNFIKAWFIDSANKTGCRFIVVDAYNKKDALNFYEKNGFTPIFSKKEDEREYTKDSREGDLKTRLMYFDLITLNSEE